MRRARLLTSISRTSSSLTNKRRWLYLCPSFLACCLATTTAAAAFTPEAYDSPVWCKPYLQNTPKNGRLRLANLPTPLYRLNYTNHGKNNDWTKVLHDLDIALFVKRDDCSSGVELGGNKVRKLEFLLADALSQNYDQVVTIGGEQSNHARATAAACRMVGLEPHLILRTKKDASNVDLTGNLLVDRMMGSTIYTCTPGEYGRVGSNELVARVCAHLQQTTGKKAYPIPVGGSNGLGSWGYIHAVQELLEQWEHLHHQDVDDKRSSAASSSPSSLDHIVFACGSGGTATGIALGIAFAYYYNNNAAEADNKKKQSAILTKMPMIHAIGVCDDEDYFYNFVAHIADEMGIQLPSSEASTEDFVRKHLIVHQGKGLGYAISTPEELDFVTSFARETGIVLDPVYSGKALYNFFQNVIAQSAESEFRGTNVLFWHTGGALGLFDKCGDLLPMLQKAAPCERLDVYGKGTGIDVSQPISEDDN